MNEKDIPILNANDAHDTAKLCHMWAGKGYGPDTEVYVWGAFEDAFEHLVEYLDDHAPGLLVSHADFRELLEDAVRELYPAYASLEAFEADHPCCGVIDNEADKVLQHAEMDLTLVGHTSLDHGNHIASHEWGGSEVDHGSEEYVDALVRSYEENLRADRDQLIAQLQDVRDNDCPDVGKHNEGDTSIDVRLQFRGHTWDLHFGEACYDQDHRGAWGSSCVSAEDSGADLIATADDLISQVLDFCAQNGGAL